MYQALYRKWRPKAFTDVVGQQSITVTLQNEVKSGNVSHAYLFTGSRGTGKTTCAKIMAKAVNCLQPEQGNPCNACENCTGIENGSILDVLELDAASNNGVENIRDMIDETNFTPVKTRYRVYIIDEVHMLSASACNAFLKTLEDPPTHVIFILATTDPQKLLATIRSRCQRFDFKRIYPEDIVGRLQFVAQQEGMTLENDAAVLIARIADGALRDALSLLDVCSVKSREITAGIVAETAGMADKEYLFALAGCIITGDCAKALELIQELHNNSCEMDLLCSEMINHLRSLMIVKTIKSEKSASQLLICTESDFARLKQQADLFSLNVIISSLLLLEGTAGNIARGVNKRVELEIALIRLCGLVPAETDTSVERRLAALEAGMKPMVPASISPAAHSDPPQKSEPAAGKIFVPAIVPLEIPDRLPIVVAPEEPAALPDAENSAENAAQEKEEPYRFEPSASGNDTFSFWPEIIKELSNKVPGLWSFLYDSAAFVQENNLIIRTKDRESLERILSTCGHSEKLSALIIAVAGRDYKIVVADQIRQESNQRPNIMEMVNKYNK